MAVGFCQFVVRGAFLGSMLCTETGAKAHREPLNAVPGYLQHDHNEASTNPEISPAANTRPPYPKIRAEKTVVFAGRS